MVSRVQVILSEFFQDHRQKVFVRIDAEWTNVKDLQDHIISLFKLPTNAIYLKSESGILFPKKESILIIQPGDVLIVCLSSQENYLNAVGKRKKIKIKATETSPNSGNLFKEFEPPVVPLFAGDNNYRDASQIVDNSVALESQANNNVTSKRKRLRKRKGKMNQPIINMNELCLNDGKQKQTEGPPPPRKFRDENHEFWVTSYHTRKHVMFDDDGEPEQKVDGLLTSKLPLIAKARLLKPLPANLPAKEVTDDVNEQAKVSIQGVNKDLQSPGEVEPFCIVLEETLADATTSDVSQANTTAEEVTPVDTEEYSELKIVNLPVITTLPKKSDVVAFKMLKMNASYEPTVSQLIVGLVEVVDEATSDICFLIKSGLSEFSTLEGKFSLANDENGKTMYDIDKTTWVNFKDMLEPRQIK